jgi:hypothetical protein
MFSSCASPKNRAPVKEGCYYYGNKAIFKIGDGQGTLKIPGDIKTFKVTAYGDDAAAEVDFSPSFILNNDPTTSTLINMKFDNGRTRSQTQTVSAVSTNPSFKINWAAYGESSLHLGKPC